MQLTNDNKMPREWVSKRRGEANDCFIRNFVLVVGHGGGWYFRLRAHPRLRFMYCAWYLLCIWLFRRFKCQRVRTTCLGRPEVLPRMLDLLVPRDQTLLCLHVSMVLVSLDAIRCCGEASDLPSVVLLRRSHYLEREG